MVLPADHQIHFDQLSNQSISDLTAVLVSYPGADAIQKSSKVTYLNSVESELVADRHKPNTIH